MIHNDSSANVSPTRRKDVCAIIVTYHPNGQFSERLQAVSRQVGVVIIVDNSSAELELAMLRHIGADPAVKLVLNPENLGVAQALNLGIQHAAALGYPWVLLLDQDTSIDEGLVQTLFTLYEAFPDKNSLAVIGSGFRDIHRSIPECDELEPAAEQWQEVDWVITSGSLIPIAAYSAIGPFRTDFFIDFVDAEYCMRARAKGYRVIKSRRQLMFHSIGRSTQHDLLGMKKWTTNHTADRRYYSARNNTVMLREYGNYRLGWWAVKGLFSCFKSYKRIMLYEQAKASKMAAVFLGWWDGIHGRMGPRRRLRARS